MKVDVDLTLTPAQIAEAFCGLNDERQAQVFIEIAKIAAEWNGSPGYQWWLVGRHLRTCECATDEAREVVDEIHRAMVYEAHALLTREDQ